MDTRDTIDVAALLSAHAYLLVESPLEERDEAVRRVWRLGRERVADWTARLHDLNESADPRSSLAAAEIAREFLGADVLARVWIALLFARAKRHDDVDLQTIGHSLLLGRLRARRFVLRWLLDEPGLADSVLASIDRLRRRSERWTDMLLAPLVSRFDLDDVAFDAKRCRDFAADEIAEAAYDPSRPVWQLLLTGIRVAFADLPDDDATRRANSEFVSAILAGLPVDVFELDGTFRTLTHARIRRGSEDSDTPYKSGVDLLLSMLHSSTGKTPGRG